MQKIIDEVAQISVRIALKLLIAIAIYVIGKFLIQKLCEILKKMINHTNTDPTVKSFLDHFVKGAMYIVLFICMISVLGVPMASVITVLASAGVAIGLALQGALSNLAGGIMLMVLRPFAVNEYIASGNIEGTVKEIGLFYTVLITVDGCKVTIPNGTLMNANVIDYSSEKNRRIEMTFLVAQGSNMQEVENLLRQGVENDSRLLKTPAPFIQYLQDVGDGMKFVVRVWVKNEIFWDVYFDLQRSLTKSLRDHHFEAPKQRVLLENRDEGR